MTFRGWPPAAIEFFVGLEADNSKSYWQAHKQVYEDAVRAPMEALLADLEPEFGAGKIFRPYRDVRFSRDKSPYKTQIAATLADGGYLHLDADILGVGCGLYRPDPEHLDAYRRAVADDGSGPALEKIITAARKQRITVSGHEELKKAPRGYAKDHPRIDLLRQKGVVAWREWPVGAWLASAKAKQRVVDFLHAAAPLRAWLAEHVG
jgi:uncharacterized protein (TIGR02453 family)